MLCGGCGAIVMALSCPSCGSCQGCSVKVASHTAAMEGCSKYERESYRCWLGVVGARKGLVTWYLAASWDDARRGTIQCGVVPSVADVALPAVPWRGSAAGRGRERWLVLLVVAARVTAPTSHQGVVGALGAYKAPQARFDSLGAAAWDRARLTRWLR
jgi:hypothetical protein